MIPEEQRQQKVYQSNDLVRSGMMHKMKSGLTLPEQKLVLYMISKIRPEDDDFKYYEFQLKEICEVMGVDSRSGKNYSDIRAAVKHLATPGWITLDDEEITVSWIAKARMRDTPGVIRVRFDEDLKPYLLGLKKNFTAYQLENALVMKSKYALQLYELLLSYVNLTDIVQIRVADLKSYLGIGSDKYTEYKDFKRRVLIPAVEQINTFTDLQVTYTPIRAGHSISSIQFHVYLDDSAASPDRWKRAALRYKELSGD